MLRAARRNWSNAITIFCSTAKTFATPWCPLMMDATSWLRDVYSKRMHTSRGVAIRWTRTGIIVSRVSTADATGTWSRRPAPSACPRWSKQASIAEVTEAPRVRAALHAIVMGKLNWAVIRNGPRRSTRSVPQSPMERASYAWRQCAIMFSRVST